MKRRYWLVLGILTLTETSSPSAFAQACNDAFNSQYAYTPGSTACQQAIAQDGRAVDGIFRTADGRTASDLIALAHPPDGGAAKIQFGKLVTAYPGCAPSQPYGWTGDAVGTQQLCPGGYTTTTSTVTLKEAVDELDWVAGQRPREVPFNDPTVGADGGLADAGAFCPPGNYVPDNDQRGYNPWEGMVFDLGGPSNKVALFPFNDHGPQPCESIEYTVYLTNNPFARSKIDDPTTTGADPNQWNRARLDKIFLHGWIDQRNVQSDYRPFNNGQGYPTACGDIKTVAADGGLGTPSYAVETDSFTSVWALPCGINFRYAAVLAGNDGRDFAACRYDSYDDELDAVLGLSEEGNAVCKDADGDGYPSCDCPTAPKICDCDDSDPNTHPNAPEACDATKDYNCNGHYPEPCPPGDGCDQGVCLPLCSAGEIQCLPGASCQQVAGQALCVPSDCTTSGCPPGSTCDPATKKCLPACTKVVCPPGQECVTGQCVDPCAQVQCSAGFYCADGKCRPPCSCYAGNVGCSGGLVCDRPTEGGVGSDRCVTSDCKGVTCPSGQVCVAGKGCQPYCSGVVCPPGQVCVPPSSTSAGQDAGAGYGCVNLCTGVSCDIGMTCDPATGKCITNTGIDASLGGSGSIDDAGRGAESRGSVIAGDSGGCGCRAAGGKSGNRGLLALISGFGLALMTLRRRRNRSRFRLDARRRPG